MVQRLLPNNPVAKIASRRPPEKINSEPDLLKMGLSSASLYLDSLQRFVPSLFKPQNTANVRFLVYGILFGFSFSLTTTSLALYYREKRQRDIMSRFTPRPIELKTDEIVHGVTGLIGRPICTWGHCACTDPLPQGTPP